MEMLVHLDEAAQIRAGIEPQQSTVTVDVPLSQWPQWLRDWLAERGNAGPIGSHPWLSESLGTLPTAVAETQGQDPHGEGLTECSPELALQLLERRVGAEVLRRFFAWLDRLGKDLDRARSRAEQAAEIERYIASLTPEALLTSDGLNVISGQIPGPENVHRIHADGHGVPPELRPKLADLKERAADIAARNASARSAAIEQWIEAHMGPEALARHREGYLPDEELCAAARKLLFAAFDDAPRYKRLYASDAEHEEDCDVEDADDENVEFDVHDAEELTRTEYQQLLAYRELAPTDATVEPREHTLRCRACDFTVYRRSARVTMEWHGRTFTREYAL